MPSRLANNKHRATFSLSGNLKEVPTLEPQTLEDLCINTIRILSADAVQNANSGHPGLPMGAAAMAYTLWQDFLKHNPKDPKWVDRDRFVLSAGHGSMLLYSLLHLTGYDLSLEDLKQFRQWGSKTPGHPERGHTPGVEVATGPLGQGSANAVGMAIAEAFLAAKYNRPGLEIVDHFTYGIVSDGDLMEGISAEAASLAGHLRLGKLIYLYDHNHISLGGATELSFTEDVGRRYEAYGWHVRHVEEGNNTEEIARAIQEAQCDVHRPSIILVHTTIGYGSPNKQNSYHSHGSPLGEEELAKTKVALGWPTTDKFYLPADALTEFRAAITKGADAQAAWNTKFDAYKTAFPAEAAEFEMIQAGKLPEGWESALPKWKVGDKAVATRVTGGETLNAIANALPNIIGGSADLNPSTNTAMKGLGDFQPSEVAGPGTAGAVGGVWGYGGHNIAFGVREHAMGAAVNGMAAHGGVIPFSATFFVFSDYMKPAMRLGAIMGVKAIYVFTHDSVGVGEDGPTHEPIEQLAGVRAIPGLTVLRAADANESSESWAYAIKHNGPTLLVFTRQNLPILDRSAAVGDLTKGAYIIADAEGGSPDVILIGSGSEVQLCVGAQQKLKEAGIKARVVSMPSMSLFDAQDATYKESILPAAVTRRVSVEAGCTFGWHKYVGLDGIALGIDHYGASAPGERIFKEFGFTIENVTALATSLVKKA
jgi:transketolase